MRHTGGAQAIGPKPTQEDALVVERLTGLDGEDAFLLLVADGVGGSPAGEVAAAIVAQEVPRWLKDHPPATGQTLREALVQASLAVLQAADHRPDRSGMSSTCTAVLVQGERLMLAHVGDSRAYYCDRAGRLTQLTIDHTWRQEALDAGRAFEDVQNNPNGDMITRYLGDGAPLADVDTRACPPGGGAVCDTASEPLVVTGGQVLLCTDGLSGTLSAEQIAATLRRYPAHEAAQRLVDKAIHAGAGDNVTAVVLDLEPRWQQPAPTWVQVAVPLALASLLTLLLWPTLGKGRTVIGSKGSVGPALVLSTAAPQPATAQGARATVVTEEVAQATATLAPFYPPEQPDERLGDESALPEGALVEPTSPTLAAADIPVLLFPEDGAQITNTSTKLDWTSSPLAENEQFMVWYYREADAADVGPVGKPIRDTFAILTFWGNGTYCWWVERQALSVGAPPTVTAQSEQRCFSVGVPSTGGHSAKSKKATEAPPPATAVVKVPSTSGGSLSVQVPEWQLTGATAAPLPVEPPTAMPKPASPEQLGPTGEGLLR